MSTDIGGWEENGHIILDGKSFGYCTGKTQSDCGCAYGNCDHLSHKFAAYPYPSMLTTNSTSLEVRIEFTEAVNDICDCAVDNNPVIAAARITISTAGKPYILMYFSNNNIIFKGCLDYKCPTSAVILFIIS